MASMEYTVAPTGMTLEAFRCHIAHMASKLNVERKKGGIPGFATVYVTDVLDDPRPNIPPSFVIFYSDHDEVAPRHIKRLLKEIRRKGRKQNGDPHLA